MNIGTILTLATVIIIAILLVVIIRLYQSIKNLNASFGRLGYLAREDVKQYFDQAANHALDLYSKTAIHNQESIDNSLHKVISESTTIMKGVIVASEKEAAAIIAKAHQDAAVIIQDGHRDAEKYRNQVVEYSADAVEWAMGQYLKLDFKLEDHEVLVNKLIGIYLDEHHKI
jgi:hypothetical protein